VDKHTQQLFCTVMEQGCVEIAGTVSGNASLNSQFPLVHSRRQ